MAELIRETELFGTDIPRLEGLREKGRAAFRLPTPKTEAWKYTRLHVLKNGDFVPPASKFLAELSGEDGDGCGCSGCHDDGCCSRETEHHCCGESCGCEKEGGKDAGHCRCGHCHGNRPELPFAAYPLHFDNGQFVPVYPVLPRGVEVMTLMEAFVNGEENHLLGKYIDLNQYPFAALNTAYLEEGLFIRVGRGVRLSRPLALVFHTDGGTLCRLANVRNLIVLEEGAAAGLVEYYCYDGAPKSCYFNNIVNEIYLGAGAELNHYKFQNEACKAAHIAFNAVRIKRNGVYNGFCLQKGADLGRNETRVQLLEEEAKAEVNAAYLMNGWATLDTTTDIEHLAEKTYSSQLIKGVVGGEAKGVFQGKIRIAPNAQKTEGRQLHKALLLSDTAEIDVKPELEIYADDVKCSHGAASGELDQEQLFYLRSRGIGEEEARQMLIDAYLTDVVARVDDPEIRDWLRGQI